MDMTTVMNSAGNSPAEDDLRVAVAELFSVFQRLFGAKWKATFDDAHARPAWYAAFRAHRVAAVDVRRGMAAAAAWKWPPSSGEFIALCTGMDDAPTLRAAVAEAVQWANGRPVDWSHPAIGAAARDIGTWTIKQSSDHDLARVFDVAYRQMLERHRRGESLDVPTARAIPPSIRNTTPPGAPPSPTTAAEIARAAAAAGVHLG